MSDIAELFEKDPLSLTREDRTAIIQKFRDNRALYIAGICTPKVTKPKAMLNLDELEV